VSQQVEHLSNLLPKTRVAQHPPTSSLNGENFHHQFKRFQTATVLFSAAVKRKTLHPLAFRSLAWPHPNTKL